MKKWIEKYKSWIYETRKAWAQRYADLIINKLEISNSDREFDHWMNQGIMLNSKMVELYDIYLD